MSYFSDLAIEKEEQAAAARFEKMKALVKAPLLLAVKNASLMLAYIEENQGFNSACHSLDNLEQLINDCLEELENNVKQ